MTKKIAMVAAALLLLAGCATKEMKSTPFYEGNDVAYTGKPEDRVNAWPIAYWREPVGSVLWPLTSFSDDHFALRPVYSQYRQDGKDGAFDEFNFLWPLCQADLKGDDYRIFPLFWGLDSKHHAYQTLFPVYWNGDGYNSLFPLWIYRGSNNARHLSVLSGAAGVSSEKEREANWCFPLWYWNSGGTFMTTLFGRWENGWALPPLFSWGESETNGNWKARFLLGLGGATKLGDYFEHWAFPLYNSEEYVWKDTNLVHNTHLLMNLVGWESWKSNCDEIKSSYAFPLYGWERDKRLLTPLFYWNKNGSMFTTLGGRMVDRGIYGDTTTNIYITPFVSIASGVKTGGMVFPLWKHERHANFGKAVDSLDGEQLPDTFDIWTYVRRYEKTKHLEYRELRDLDAHDETNWLLLFPWSDSIEGNYVNNNSGKSCAMTRSIKRGNYLPFRYEYTRKATYSVPDLKKRSDTENSDASFLIWLYNYKHENDLMKADAYTQHRVLWRLWDWEEKNGDVTLDVFPGFTYDSKTNGYAKTSFLWRLFRYENDPEKGTAVDLLFIPVWR